MAVSYVVVTGTYTVRMIGMLRQAKGCEREAHKVVCPFSEGTCIN